MTLWFNLKETSMTTQAIGYKAKAFEPRNLAFIAILSAYVLSTMVMGQTNTSMTPEEASWKEN